MTRKPVVAAAAVGVLVLAWLLWPAGDGSATLRAGNAQASVRVVLDHPRVGATGAVTTVTGADGRPVSGMFVRLQAVMPLTGYAGPEVVAVAGGPGRYTASGVGLMTTGQWELHLRLDGGAELVLPFQVTG